MMGELRASQSGYQQGFANNAAGNLRGHQSPTRQHFVRSATNTTGLTMPPPTVIPGSNGGGGGGGGGGGTDTPADNGTTTGYWEFANNINGSFKLQPMYFLTADSSAVWWYFTIEGTATGVVRVTYFPGSSDNRFTDVPISGSGVFRAYIVAGDVSAMRWQYTQTAGGPALHAQAGSVDTDDTHHILVRP